MLLRGIGRWLAEHPRSNLTITLADARQSVAHPARYDAMIYQGLFEHLCEVAERFSRPAINITSNVPGRVPTNSILSDDLSIAQQAIDHLIEYGRQSIVLITAGEKGFHHTRTQAFLTIARRRGFDPPVLQLQGDASDAQRADFVQQVQRLGESLALFTTDDIVGGHVCAAMDAAGISIPETYVVLSVGNDMNVCEFTHPPLSSIDNAIDLRGYHAIDEVLKQLAGAPPLAAPMLIQPRGVVIRRSSDMHAVADPDVRAALSFIHQHADQPLGVEDVVHHVQISRRTMEQKFRRFLNRTVHEEIWQAHMKTARQLLMHTDLPIFMVASRSGFGSMSSLCTLFRRREDMTPNDFRNFHRGRPVT